MELSEARVDKGYIVKKIDLPFETERRLQALEQALAQEEVVLERRVCPLCGRSFVPKRRQLYCSPVCQAEANRRKSRARMRNKRAKDGFRCYDLSPQKPCK